jgi:hypothetical protein
MSARRDEGLSADVGAAAVRALVESNPGQATEEEYAAVRDAIMNRAPCNVLVFGFGLDAPLWLAANPEGRTTFLESDPGWLARAGALLPGVEIHPVR